MSDTTFVDRQTPILASWLNDVNDHVYNHAFVAYVTDFGATGVGSDDSVAIQNAINYVSENGGGELIFPPGIYGIGSSVTIPSNVHLKGHGMGISTIKALSSLPITSPMMLNESGDTGAGIRVDEYITLSHLTFDGSGRSYPAYDQNTNPPTYGGLSQTNARGHLLRFYSCIGTQVLNCEFTGHESLVLVMAGGLNELVQGCYFHDNGKIDDISPCIYANFSFPNSTPSINLRIIGNTFDTCNRGGIRFVVGSGTIAGNTLTNLREYGIHVNAGSDVSITGNVIDDVTISDIVANGIEIQNSNAGRIAITGNMIGSCGLRAISAVGMADFTIAGNVINECGFETNYPTPNGPLNYSKGRAANDPITAERKAGIHLITGDTYNCKRGAISGNVITSVTANMTYGMSFENTGTPLLLFDDISVTGNTITGQTDDRYQVDADSWGENFYIVDPVDDGSDRVGQALDLSIGYSVTGSAALTNMGANASRSIAFDAAATEDWQWVLAPPPDKPAGDTIIGVRLWCQKPVGAGTGDVRFQVGTLLRSVTNSIGGGSFTSEAFTVTVAEDADQTTDIHDLILTSSVLWPAANFLVLRLSRLGADGADTWANDYHVISIQIIYK